MKKIIYTVFALALVLSHAGNVYAKKAKTPTPIPSTDINLSMPAMDFVTSEEAIKFLQDCKQNQFQVGQKFGDLKIENNKILTGLALANVGRAKVEATNLADQIAQKEDLNLAVVVARRIAEREKKMMEGAKEYVDKNLAYCKVSRESENLQLLMVSARNEFSRQFYFSNMAAPKAIFLAQGLKPEERKKVEDSVKELQGKMVDPSALVVPASVSISSSPTATPIPTGGSPTATPNLNAPTATPTPMPPTNTPVVKTSTTASTATPDPKATSVPVATAVVASVPATPPPPQPMTLENLPAKFFGFTADALVVKGFTLGVELLEKPNQVIVTSAKAPEGTLPNGWGKINITPVFGQYYVIFPAPPVPSKHGDAYVYRLK